MEGTTADQFETVLEEFFSEKKVSANLHGTFVIKHQCQGQMIPFRQMFARLLLI